MRAINSLDQRCPFRVAQTYVKAQSGLNLANVTPQFKKKGGGCLLFYNKGQGVSSYMFVFRRTSTTKVPNFTVSSTTGGSDGQPEKLEGNHYRRERQARCTSHRGCFPALQGRWCVHIKRVHTRVKTCCIKAVVYELPLFVFQRAVVCVCVVGLV